MLVVRREVSQQFYLYGGVSMAELSEVKKLVLSLSDREIIALLGLQNNMNGRILLLAQGIPAVGLTSSFLALTAKECLA